MSSDPTCILDVDRDLVLALESAFGPPIDSYLNGWQVWIEPSSIAGPDGEPLELELRLHPPAGFAQPDGMSHHDLWDAVVERLAAGDEVLRLGEEERRLDEVWTLLEVYPAFGDPVAPEDLAVEVERLLARPVRASGYVDHARLGNRWKRTKGRFDLVAAVREALAAD